MAGSPASHRAAELDEIEDLPVGNSTRLRSSFTNGNAEPDHVTAAAQEDAEEAAAAPRGLAGHHSLTESLSRRLSLSLRAAAEPDVFVPLPLPPSMPPPSPFAPMQPEGEAPSMASFYEPSSMPRPPPIATAPLRLSHSATQPALPSLGGQEGGNSTPGAKNCALEAMRRCESLPQAPQDLGTKPATDAIVAGKSPKLHRLGSRGSSWGLSTGSRPQSPQDAGPPCIRATSTTSRSDVRSRGGRRRSERSVCFSEASDNRSRMGRTGSLLSKSSNVLRRRFHRVAKKFHTRDLGIDLEDDRDLDTKFRFGWQSYLAAFICTAKFEIVLAICITLNTLIMAFQDQYEGFQRGYEINFTGMQQPAHEVWPHAEEFFVVVEWVFGIIFTIELLVKMAVFECRFFKEIWNWIDAIIVSGFLLERLLSSELFVSPTLLRLARLFRLLRITKLTKSMQAFDDFHLMTAALRQSLSATFFACLLLLTLQMVVALAIQHTLTGFLVNTQHSEDVRHLVYENFGTFARALFTLFQLTLANWPDAVRVLTEHVSEWWCPMLLAYVLCVSFALIRVITSVITSVTFCVYSFDDQLLMQRQERATALHLARMTKLFKAADADGNGILDMPEFCKVFADHSVQRWLGAMEFELSLFGNTAEALFSLLDDGDGMLTAQDLLEGVALNKGPARAATLAVLMTECKDNMALVDELLDFHAQERRRRRSDNLAALGRRISFTEEAPTQVQPAVELEELGKPAAAAVPSCMPGVVAADETQAPAPASAPAGKVDEHMMGRSRSEPTRTVGDVVSITDRRLSTVSGHPPSKATPALETTVSEENAIARSSTEPSAPRTPTASRRRSSLLLKSVTDLAQDGHTEVAARLFVAQKSAGSISTGYSEAGDVLEDEAPESAWHEWRQGFQAFLGSAPLEGFFIVTLLVYALICALDAQYEGLQVGFEIGYPGSTRPADEVWPGGREVLDSLQMLLGVLFIAESGLHLLRCARAFRESPWIVVDLIATCAWILEVIPDVKMPVEVSLVRLVRISRLSRLMVLVQMHSRFSSLQLIWAAVRGSLQALGWTIVTLMLGLLLVGLMMNAILEEYFFTEESSAGLSSRWSLYLYFGSFSKTILTVFELTLANWIQPTRALIENGGEWFMIYALGHKIFYGFCVITVIAAVFLQETNTIAKSDNAVQHNMRSAAARENTKKMLRLFQYADADGSGAVDLEEFRMIMRSRGVSLWMSAMGLQMDDVDALFKIIDSGNGCLTAAEFMEGIAHMKGHAKNIDMHILLREFLKLSKRLKELDTVMQKLHPAAMSASTSEVSKAAGQSDTHGASAALLSSTHEKTG